MREAYPARSVSPTPGVLSAVRYRRGVLDRRSALAALLGLCGVATAGCAVVPVGGAPTPLASPTPSLLPGQATAEALHLFLARAHAGREAWGATPAQSALLRWAVEVAAEQAEAVSVQLLPASGPASPTPASAVPDASAPPALEAELGRAAATYSATATDPGVADPLEWAAMAAWASALAAQVAAPTAALEPAFTRRRPASQTPSGAALAAIAAAEQTAYALQFAAGAPGLPPADVERVRGRLESWFALRDDLRALAVTAGATPSPGPAWYDVEPREGADAARALVAQAQSAALEVLGRTIAHGPQALRPRLVAALAEAAADVPSWGGMVRRWPGWPE